MNEIETDFSESEIPVSEQVLVVPGYLFFVESLQIPEGIDDDELTDFAELSLEGISPFPIDHVLWGFLTNEKESTILLYAAHRDRIRNEGFDHIEEYVWVLPDFATFVTAVFPEPTEIILDNPETLTRLAFKAGAECPHEISSLKRPEDASDAVEVFKSQESSTARDATLLIVESESAGVDEQGVTQFEFHSPNSYEDQPSPGNWQRLTPPESILWSADIRSREFKTEERKSRRTSLMLSKFTAYAALFAILLLLGELLMMGANLWRTKLNEKIASRSPAVRLIEDKQSLMTKLEQVAQNELQPVTILSAMNGVRLDKSLGIHFTEASVEDENKVTIEGIAQTVNELNSYTEMLQSSGAFSLIGQPKYMTRSGKTTFTLSFAYDSTQAPTPPPVQPGPPQGAPSTHTAELEEPLLPGNTEIR